MGRYGRIWDDLGRYASNMYPSVIKHLAKEIEHASNVCLTRCMPAFLRIRIDGIFLGRHTP